jgi:hypothetical protein
MEASVRLNQVTASMAKQMCRVEPVKAFSHWLPPGGDITWQLDLSP